MSGYFNLNGSVKKISGIYANINGSVKKIISGYANINGAVKKIYGEDGSGYLWVQGGGYLTSYKGIYISEKDELHQAFPQGTTIAYEKLQPFDDVFGYYGCVYSGTRFVMYCGNGQFIYSEKGRSWTKLPTITNLIPGSALSDSQKNILFCKCCPFTDGTGVYVPYNGRYLYYLSNNSDTWTEIDIWNYTTESYSFDKACCWATEDLNNGVFTLMLIKKNSDWDSSTPASNKGHLCFVQFKNGLFYNFFEYTNFDFTFQLTTSSVNFANIFYDSNSDKIYVTGRNMAVSGSPYQTYYFENGDNTLTLVSDSKGTIYPMGISGNYQITNRSYRNLSSSTYTPIWRITRYENFDFSYEESSAQQTGSSGSSSTTYYDDVGFCYNVKDLLLWNVSPNNGGSGHNYFYYNKTTDSFVRASGTMSLVNMLLFPTRVAHGKVRDD